MHLSVRKIVISLMILILVIGGSAFFFNNRASVVNLKEKTYRDLKNIRENKKDKIIKYFEDLKILAGGIKEETEIVQLFHKLVDTSKDADLENRIDFLYSSKYYKFYDILFVDIDGFIFNSIKREEDYHTNLFTGKFSNTELAKSVFESQEIQFVDYNYYMPSEEPASFFIIPVNSNSKKIGWIVLQVPLNMVNIILTGKMSKSRTTEVYLINNHNIMLSDSRFYKDSTAMKVKVNSYAVQSILKENMGERVVSDYRNIKVFSSFEKFQVFGARWTIIAEIDEDEVITEYYQENKKYFTKEIIKYLESNSVKTGISSDSILLGGRVDIGEYQRVVQGSSLWTMGVGTCTGVSVIYPDLFGYLSHISPVDDVYISGKLTEYFLGDNNTDLLGDMLRKINQFEITPSEKPDVQFFPAAIHTNSFKKIVDKILENGHELANITFLYNSKMEDVNIQLDLVNNQVNLNWSNGAGYFYNNNADYPNLSTVVKDIFYTSKVNINFVPFFLSI